MKVYRSELFGEDVYLLDNHERFEQTDPGPLFGGPIAGYRPDELKKLKGLADEDLKRVHGLKKLFAGVVTGVDR